MQGQQPAMADQNRHSTPDSRQARTLHDGPEQRQAGDHQHRAQTGRSQSGQKATGEHTQPGMGSVISHVQGRPVTGILS